LNETPSNYEKLHLDMAEEESKEASRRKLKTQKTKATKHLNHVIATEGLKKQGEVQDENAANYEIMSSPDSVRLDSKAILKSSNISNLFNSISYIETLLKPLEAASKSTAVSEEDAELDREIKRQKLRTLKAEEEYWTSKRIQNS
jgi:hypothetical protein